MINETGEEIVLVKYDYIGKFKKGKAIVTRDGMQAIIDEQGVELPLH